MKKVYIVLSKWANAEVLESNASICGVFLKKEEAIKCYNQVIKEEIDNGSLAESPDLEKEENNYNFSMWESEKYYDNHFEVKIEERFLEEASSQSMNTFIGILENKQTENQEGVEEFTEDTFENGWQSAFDVAILLVKEHPELFK